MKHYLSQHLGAKQRALAVLESLLTVLFCCLILPACPASTLPEEVSIEGYLFDRAEPAEEALPIAGAAGLVWDDEGTELGELLTPFSDYPGWYRAAALPPESRVHMRFSGPDSATTILTGWTASEDLFVDPGVFHLWTRTEALAEVRFWAGEDEGPSFAPETPDEGGALVGQLLFPLEYQGTELWVTDSEGVEHLASSTDALGDPHPEMGTGLDGRFALLGLPPGPVDIRVALAGEEPGDAVFRTWVEEDSITSLPGFSIR